MASVKTTWPQARWSKFTTRPTNNKSYRELRQNGDQGLVLYIHELESNTYWDNQKTPSKVVKDPKLIEELESIPRFVPKDSPQNTKKSGQDPLTGVSTYQHSSRPLTTKPVLPRNTNESTELAKPQGGFHAVKAEREPSESDNKPAQKNRSATPNKKQYQVPKSQRQISVQNPALPFRDKLSQNSPLGNDEDTKNLPPSKEDDLKKALQYDTNLSPRFEQLKYSQGQTRELPSDYFERPASFFRKGRVFRVLWIEPRGNTAGNGPDSYKTLRPMVVVKQYGAHCLCVPVFSHGERGVSKPGLKPVEIKWHAVIHMDDKDPELLLEEAPWKLVMQSPFPVRTTRGGIHGLSATSRIRFDMTYPVQYNLDVCDIGVIKGEDQLKRLTQCWDDACA